jgi:hypothetical protein
MLPGSRDPSRKVTGESPAIRVDYRGTEVSGERFSQKLSKREQWKMKIFDLKNKAAQSESRESLLGFHDTGSHACYMIYGVLKPREQRRQIRPGSGHEEIILAMNGDLEVTGFYSGRIKEGSAFLMRGDQECFLENSGERDAVYVIAGGHLEADGH